MKASSVGKLPAGKRVATRHRAKKRTLTNLDLLRMREAAAEATWREAKEQADQAKRRRKLARMLAKRAKRDARAARAHLDELRQALAKAEGRQIVRRRSPAIRKAATKNAVAVKPRQQARSRKRTRARPRRKAGPMTPEAALLAIIEAEKSLLGSPSPDAS